jgi:hypothetical protein
MNLVLAVFAVAFVAFVVWLTVRIVNRREKWAKRMAIALSVMLIGYPLLLGPACWMSSRFEFGAGAVSAAYRPVIVNSPPDVSRMLMDYSAVWAAPKWSWMHVVEIRAGKPVPAKSGIVWIVWKRD